MKLDTRVEVLWNDITDSGADWTAVKTLKSFKPTPCHTIGYLHEETEEYIRVVTNYLTEKGKITEYSGAVVIPKGCISAVIYLEAKDE